MTLNILSLDLDWFNGFHYRGLRSRIRNLFVFLDDKCVLPRDVSLMTEHHYLYPWCLNLMRKRKSKKINIVNIDQHHDFYFLDKIKFGRGSSDITCGNFLAFMAHENILEHYTWVSAGSVWSIRADRADLLDSLREASSLRVRSMADRITVCAHTSLQTLSGMMFDGFVVIKSPGYTTRRKTVYTTVESVLGMHFPKSSIRRNRCRAEFHYSDRHSVRKKMLAV